jgi:hypothetical protein
MSCWLTGRDGYDGLIFFEHLSFIVNVDSGGSGAVGGNAYGVILPMPAPTP